MDMTVAEFEAVQPDEADAHAIGRLITSTIWYYACVVPASELSDVEEGDRATLTFARDYYQPVTMRVARLGENEAGSRLLVLSSDRALQNVTLLRQQSAEIVFTSYAGLRVPKSAVRVENGQTGVYILEGTLAKWKPITIPPRYRRKLCRHARHQFDQQPLAGRRADYQREKSIRWKGRQLICLRLLKISRISVRPEWPRPQKSRTRPVRNSALCAATKMNDAERVKEAVAAGVDCCGENRVQEIQAKRPLGAYTESPCTSSAICRPTRSSISSAWSISLSPSTGWSCWSASKSRRKKLGVVQNILFEVNIGNEESKSGFTPAEAAALAARMADFPHVALKGLMAIPP